MIRVIRAVRLSLRNLRISSENFGNALVALFARLCVQCVFHCAHNCVGLDVKPWGMLTQTNTILADDGRRAYSLRYRDCVPCAFVRFIELHADFALLEALVLHACRVLAYEPCDYASEVSSVHSSLVRANGVFALQVRDACKRLSCVDAYEAWFRRGFGFSRRLCLAYMRARLACAKAHEILHPCFSRFIECLLSLEILALRRRDECLIVLLRRCGSVSRRWWFSQKRVDFSAWSHKWFHLSWRKSCRSIHKMSVLTVPEAHMLCAYVHRVAVWVSDFLLFFEIAKAQKTLAFRTVNIVAHFF